jgi:uncharacterized membrane protein
MRQGVTQVPACFGCGEQIPDWARFCPTCGAVVSRPQSQASASPPSVAPAPALDPHQTAIDIASSLPDNIAGMLAYFILPAVVFLLVRPFNRNRFVRFHSIQCLLTVTVLIVLQIALALFGKLVPLLVLSAYGLLLLAEITLWLLLLYKAYQHETFKLPVVGDTADRLAA